jgi:radical SAM-linked protein
VHIGLNNWWLVKEWQKAVAATETAPCTENVCHACGVCTELDTTHELASAKPEVMKKNPFVKEIPVALQREDKHPSLVFETKEPMPEAATNQRLRFVFSKLGDLRFISHLDLQHLLARAARRAGLSVAYSQGFNPSPKLNLAAPLALFQESVAEIGEIDLAQHVDPLEFEAAINAQLPEEIQITACKEVKGNASLASSLAAGTYIATPVRAERAFIESLPEKINSLLSQTELFAPAQNTAERAQKNLRPGIISIALTDQGTGTLELELAHGPTLHVKPNEVLQCLQPFDESHPSVVWRIRRCQLKAQNSTPLFSV